MHLDTMPRKGFHMRKSNKVIRRGSLNQGERIFRVNHVAHFNGGEDFHATVLRSHPDPRMVVVRFDYDQSVRAVAWRRFYKVEA